MTMMTQSDVAERAVAHFREGLYCSEAILRAFDEARSLGMPEEFFRIGTGFGAGMGGAQCSCGGVTGAQIILSLRLGRLDASESEVPSFEAAAELHDRFKAEHKFICCRALTRPVEWGSDEHHAYCERFVRSAVLITQEILARTPSAVESRSGGEALGA